MIKRSHPYQTRVLNQHKPRRRWLFYTGVLTALVTLGAGLGHSFARARVQANAAPQEVNPVVETPTVAAIQPSAVASASRAAIETGVPVLPTVANGRPQVQVVGAELGLWLRQQPTLDSAPVKSLSDGATLWVIGADVLTPQRTWKHVRDDQGSEGWIAAEYVAPLSTDQ